MLFRSLVDDGAEFLLIASGRGLTEQGFEHEGSEHLIAFVGEVKSIDGGRPAQLGPRFEDLLGRDEEIHERHAIGLGHVRHRSGVVAEIGIVRRGVGEVRVLMLFVGDGGEEDDAGRTLAGVILRRRVLEKLAEVGLDRKSVV